MTELVDVYDRDRRPTGRIVPRGSRFGEGEYRLIVHICLFNSRGEMLIQQRSPEKRSYGGYWDVSAGGHSMAGENSAAAASRELFEELGLSRDFSHTAPAISVFFADGFDDYYIIRSDNAISDFKVQEDEVSAIRWASLDEIRQMMKTGDFVPYREAFPALLFELNEAGCNILGE